MKERTTMTIKRWAGPALAVAVLAGAFTGCDYINPTTQNPNAVPNATIDQLFVSSQVGTFFDNEGDLSRMAAIWTQQMDGTDRQYATYAAYNISEANQPGDNEWARIYQGGGLVDLRQAEALADSSGRFAYEGILQIYEALDIELAASTWGDVPYSQALQADAPLDGQLDVYTELETTLDNAIANLQQGGGGPGASDFNFGGDVQSWLAVAHSLKARIYMHLASTDPTAYGKALTEAQQGISDPAGNWLAINSSTKTENNIWFQFNSDRSGYISSGAFLVDTLNAMNDPRLPIYFTEADASVGGGYQGSPPGTPTGDPSSYASQLNVPGQADYSMPILTCSETQFIIAEAQYEASNTAGAQQAAQDGLTCQEDYWASLGYPIDLSSFKTNIATLTGTALFNEIMTQKYIADFLNHETWRDWLRTCQPAITPYNGEKIPDRVFYPSAERQNNTNIDQAGTGNNSSPVPDDPRDSCTQ
jgi:hypothetical protein